jgi:hypothetical protein
MKTSYKTSPWGTVQDTTVLAEGICSVTTASHGGIKLSAARQALMPEDWRCDGGWYEEDCDWCLPFVIFQADIMVYNDDYAVRNIAGGDHFNTLKNWHPDKFEQWFGITINPGESYIREFRTTHPEFAH